MVITGSGFTGATGVCSAVHRRHQLDLSVSAVAGRVLQRRQRYGDRCRHTRGSSRHRDGGCRSSTAVAANGPADDYSYFDPPTVTNVTPGSEDQGATVIAVTGNELLVPGRHPTHQRRQRGRPQPHERRIDDSRSPTRALGRSPIASISRTTATSPSTCPTRCPPATTTSRWSLRAERLRPRRPMSSPCPAPTPTLTTLTPPSGSTLGGNDVNLTGTRLHRRDRCELRVGRHTKVCGTGTCFTVDSDTSITVDSVPGERSGPGQRHRQDTRAAPREARPTRT